MLAEYFKKIGGRRILIMILGNVFLGMGVSIFKLAGLGNDAYNGMVMALSDCVRVPYEHFFVVFSLCLFVIELLAGRHFVGIGTIVNTFLLGYVVTFFYELWLKFFQAPQILWQQLYLPVNSGALFSRKAPIPSLLSSVEKAAVNVSISNLLADFISMS